MNSISFLVYFIFLILLLLCVLFFLILRMYSMSQIRYILNILQLNSSNKVPQQYSIFYRYFINMNVEKIQPSSLLEPIERTVPKKIFRLWCTKDHSKPCGGRGPTSDAIRITQSILPDWEQIIFGDKETEEFLMDYFGSAHQITKAYYLINNKYGAAKADLIRYTIIYVFGGLYLDMKSCISNKKLPEIPNDKDIIVSHWKQIYKPQSHLFTNGELQNWYIYARPRSPILWEIIERTVQNIMILHEKPYLEPIYKGMCLSESESKGIVLTTTGPIVLSLTILNSKYKNTVLFSDEINNCVNYLCVNNKSITGQHYSMVYEQFIFTKPDALYIPKLIHVIDKHNIFDIKLELFYRDHNFDVQNYDNNICLNFINDFFGKDVAIKCNNIKDENQKNMFVSLCILYVYGGCIFNNTKFNQPITEIFNFKLRNTWYIGINKQDDLYIVTPPKNLILYKLLSLFLVDKPFSIKKIFIEIQLYIRKSLILGENIYDDDWKCIILERQDF